MLPFRTYFFFAFCLSLWLVSLQLVPVRGFAVVVGKIGALSVRNDATDVDVQQNRANGDEHRNLPVLDIRHSVCIRRNNRNGFLYSASRSRTLLNAIPISSSSIISLGNTQLSIGMGLLHLLLGSLGTPIVANAISVWYKKIDKPKWTPPNRIFAPTWTILYTLMGIAFSRILQQLRVSTDQSVFKHRLLFVWTGHMLLNITWAPIFFGLQRLRAGLYINYALLFTLCGIIIPWYSRIDIIAMYMVVPYAIWLLYATCLNRSICMRNSEPYNTARFYSDLYKLQQQALKYANS